MRQRIAIGIDERVVVFAYQKKDIRHPVADGTDWQGAHTSKQMCHFKAGVQMYVGARSVWEFYFSFYSIWRMTPPGACGNRNIVRQQVISYQCPEGAYHPIHARGIR
jgi:hypothetical protein